jgi:hypothetical protein
MLQQAINQTRDGIAGFSNWQRLTVKSTFVLPAFAVLQLGAINYQLLGDAIAVRTPHDELIIAHGFELTGEPSFWVVCYTAQKIGLTGPILANGPQRAHVQPLSLKSIFAW